jgi:hypothetical protein
MLKLQWKEDRQLVCLRNSCVVKKDLPFTSIACIIIFLGMVVSDILTIVISRTLVLQNDFKVLVF